MTRSLNIPLTKKLVWDTVTDLATKSHVLKEQVKKESMSVKSKSDADSRSTVRNLQKT